MIKRKTTEVLIDEERDEVLFMFEENGEKCAEVCWLDHDDPGSVLHCTAIGLNEDMAKTVLRPPKASEAFKVRRVQRVYEQWLKEATDEGAV